ncbi:MAG: hypothetical protein ACPG5K_09205, partial [Glaciecola sp.]
MLSIKKFFKVCICVVVLGVFSSQSYAGGHGSPSQNSIHNWDMDSDGNVDALTDGLLMLRYTFNLRGDSLTAGAIATGAALTPSEVEERVGMLTAIADIDGNNQVDALTDGLLLLRY